MDVVSRGVTCEKSCSSEPSHSTQNSADADAVFENETCISLNDESETSQHNEVAPNVEMNTAPTAYSTDSVLEHEPSTVPDSSSPVALQPAQQLRRSTRARKPPSTWWKALLTANTHTDLPRTYNEALTGPHAAFWKTGIDKERASQAKNEAWKLVPRSTGQNVFTSRWVFTTKQIPAENGCASEVA